MKRVRGGPVLWCLTSLATALVGGSVGAGTAGTETYTYDALGRLVKVEPPDGTLSSYGYDKAGNRLSVNTGTDITAPSVPTGLAKVSATSLQVVLSWTASTDTGGSGLSGYRIYRAVSPFTTFVQLSPGTSPTAGYTDGTTAGTIGYQYKVAAVDVVGNVSAQSIALAVTTPDTIAPSVPTGIAGAAASAAQINLSWNASTDTGGSGLKGYKVFRNGSPVVTTTTTASTYSDTGLTASTTYSYAVGAYDVAGNMSAQSGPVSATTLSSAGGMFSFVSGSHTSVGSSSD